MKIAILGTKGIPNNYGGYEQFAEYISTRLVQRGHFVTVYNPSFHSYKEGSFNGVIIRRIFSPEKLIGGVANIVYDHLCLKDALSQDFDIIYEAGYHSVALSLKFYNVKKRLRPIVITNMDGLEWKRTKWNRIVQNIIRKLEKIAVNESPYLISDNKGIQEYLQTNFNKHSHYIPYGADPIDSFNQEYLKWYAIEPWSYFMLVARLEPENNIEIILNGLERSKVKESILIVGNNTTKYGRYLKDKYENPAIKFVGGIYEKTKLDSLRFFAKIYFHGHSVGGTNPSLLEAMACQSFICAHQNPFNESVLGDDALYFHDEENVSRIIEKAPELREKYFDGFRKSNFKKIAEVYNWEAVVKQHEELFISLLSKP
jgi:glycosyltransferase involved in cell wall biosynthesis